MAGEVEPGTGRRSKGGGSTLPGGRTTPTPLVPPSAPSPVREAGTGKQSITPGPVSSVKNRQKNDPKGSSVGGGGGVKVLRSPMPEEGRDGGEVSFTPTTTPAVTVAAGHTQPMSASPVTSVSQVLGGGGSGTTMRSYSSSSMIPRGTARPQLITFDHIRKQAGYAGFECTTTSTFGVASTRADVTGLRNIVENLFPSLVHKALDMGAPVDPTDISTGVEAAFITDYMDALMGIFTLASFLSPPPMTPVTEEIFRVLRRKRARISALIDDISQFHMPQIYVDVCARYARPTAADPDGPFFCMLPQSQDLTDSSGMDTFLTNLEASVTSLRDSDEAIKWHEVMKRILPAPTFPPAGLVIDPGVVTEYMYQPMLATISSAKFGLPALDEGTILEFFVPFGGTMPPWLFSLFGLNKCFETQAFATEDVVYGQIGGLGQSTALAVYSGVATIDRSEHTISAPDIDGTTIDTLPQFSFPRGRQACAGGSAEYGNFMHPGVLVIDVPFDDLVINTYSILRQAWHLV